MRYKKILSTIAALAVAATSFAGLGISANAATEIITEDFSDSDEAGSYWTTTGTGESKTIVENDMLTFYLTSGNGRNTTVTLGATSSATYQRIKFDFKGYTTNYADTSGYFIQDTSGNQVFRLTYGAGTGAGAAKPISVNGTEIAEVTEDSNETWYTFDAVCDFENHTFDYNIYEQGGSVALASATGVAMSTDTCSNIGKIYFYVKGSGKCIYLDNFVLSSLTEPAFTLSSEETVALDSTENTSADITLSGVTGDITVSSSDEKVAKAEYDNNETITITYVGDGTAKVTVTATSEDDVEVSKELDVECGKVAKADVTVNYYKTGTTTPVKDTDTTTFANVPVGTEITLDELVTDTTFTSDTAKYVYNSSAEGTTALPYTVVDGVNTINVYFDEFAKVASYKVNYTGVTKDADTITLTDAYVGDAYSYTPSKYVKDSNNKWWSTEVTAQSGNLTADTELTVAYEADSDDNIVAFIEAESLENSTAVDNGAYSGGKYAHVNGSKTASIGTLPAGKYKAEIYLEERGDRGVLINSATDNIATFDISSSSAAGVYTIDFSLNEETALVLRGITNDRSLINQSAEFDYILIRKTGEPDPVISAVATSATDVTVGTPDDKTALTGVSADTDDTTYGDIKGDKTLTTVYIKVDNAVDGVAPVLTIDEDNYQATYEGIKAYNGYYIYQILAADAVSLDSAKVTYTGAADYSAE